ncbi:MAG: hypothetical protein KOO63_05535 [Bacteroidales bacterium]|nr:hypothetical protein [Candidatus Latescibacterota bacterium]
MAVATSTLIAAGVSAAAATGSAAIQAKSASKAQATIRDAAAQSRADLQPWRAAGEDALKLYDEKIQAGPGEFTESPGYQFRMEEGEKAARRAASAKGELGSGKFGKELVRYGQDYATDERDRFLARYYQSLEPLRQMAGVGQASAAGQVAAGSAAAGQIASAEMAKGEAYAGAGINVANVARSTARDVTLRDLAKEDTGVAGVADAATPAGSQFNRNTVDPVNQKVYG